jgi:tight adherence protein B
MGTTTVALMVSLSWALILGLLGGTLVYQLRFGPQAVLRRRIKSIVDPDSGTGSSSEAAGTSQRRAVQAKLKELEAAGKASKRFVLRQKIIQAGLEMPVSRFYFVNLGVGIATTVLFMLLQLGPWFVAPLVGIPAGFFLPTMVLGFLAKRRQTKFTSYFADAVDVIVRGIQSGLPVGECMRVIARESPEPVCTEFRMFTDAQKLGLTLDEALDRAIERMPTAELKFFAIVLNINAQTGGNLAETLGNLSGVLRGRKTMADTIRIKSSEAKSTAYIIGSLPFCIGLMLMVMSPEYVSLLFTEKLGNYFLYGAVALMTMGSLVMKGMCNLKM